jgi:hypothetical protein
MVSPRCEVLGPARPERDGAGKRDQVMGALGTLPSRLGMGGLARSHQKVTATWFEQTAVATAQTLYV